MDTHTEKLYSRQRQTEDFMVATGDSGYSPRDVTDIPKVCPVEKETLGTLRLSQPRPPKLRAYNDDVSTPTSSKSTSSKRAPSGRSKQKGEAEIFKTSSRKSFKTVMQIQGSLAGCLPFMDSFESQFEY
ncbi:hypothetical protein BGX21_010892 [Mortierella sp. AD011]|nr:hypothetical protein BGX20_010942 [Mortierella sp. AD010]KAF9393158.1 hypothetical protein BGX21_010892 [Mortierella sp. AD011]